MPMESHDAGTTIAEAHATGLNAGALAKSPPLEIYSLRFLDQESGDPADTINPVV